MILIFYHHNEDNLHPGERINTCNETTLSLKFKSVSQFKILFCNMYGECMYTNKSDTIL